MQENDNIVQSIISEGVYAKADSPHGTIRNRLVLEEVFPAFVFVLFLAFWTI